MDRTRSVFTLSASQRYPVDLRVPDPLAPSFPDDHPVVGGKLLTIREASKRLGLPYSTLYSMVYAGEIVALRIGKTHMRIPENAIATFRSAALVRPDAVRRMTPVQIRSAFKRRQR